AGGWPCLPFAIPAAPLFAGGLWLLWRGGNDVWGFFAGAIARSPALFLVRMPPFLAARYFFFPLTFFFLLLALLLGALVRRGGVARAVALILLAVFLAGNAWTVSAFTRSGRGQFREALAWVIEHDPGEVVRVTGGPSREDNWRTRKYTEFSVS